MFFIQIGLGRNHLVAAAAAILKLFQVLFRFIRGQRSEISLQIEKSCPIIEFHQMHFDVSVVTDELN